MKPIRDFSFLTFFLLISSINLYGQSTEQSVNKEIELQSKVIEFPELPGDLKKLDAKYLRLDGNRPLKRSVRPDKKRIAADIIKAYHRNKPQLAQPLLGAVVAARDMGPGNTSLNLTSFTANPDNSGNNGQFPTNSLDVFGKTDRTVNSDFADDSGGSNPGDVFGIVQTADTDVFFGCEDLDNGDNSGGTGTASWVFDISGISAVCDISMDFAAMGDFELGDNDHVITASIDGSPAVTIFAIQCNETASLLYTLENGNTNTIDDPHTIDADNNGVDGFLNNIFTTYTSSVLNGQSGNALTITLNSSTNNGGSEVFAFKNIVVTGIHIPVHYYVDSSAVAGGNSGTTWADAYTDLQSALALAVDGDTICVAEGTYYPTSGTDTTETFSIPSGVVVLGGFSPINGADEINERDWETYETILCGNIGDLNESSDNSLHVVTMENVAPSTELDGFTVRDGSADRDPFENSALSSIGAGIFVYAPLSEASPTLRNLYITDNFANSGGGLYFRSMNNNMNPYIENCIFEDNTVNNGGGAVGNFPAHDSEYRPHFYNCQFLNNQAGTSGFNNGGALQFSANSGTNLFMGFCDALVENCLFVGNGAGRGAAVYVTSGANGNAYARIVNSTFTKNIGLQNGGNEATILTSAFSGDGETIVANCIVYSNSGSEPIENISGGLTTVSHTIHDGPTNGTGMTFQASLNADPNFIDPDTDFRLQTCSPAINFGSDDSLDVANTIDLDGNPRIFNADTVDAGTYELQDFYSELCSDITKLFVDSSAMGLNNGFSWDDAFTDLQDALAFARLYPQIKCIWVAKGTYFPTTSADSSISFIPVDSVALYGGFAGNEDPETYDLDLRDFEMNETILSGDIGVRGDSIDNSNTIVFNRFLGLSTPAIFDGFTFSDANANGTDFNGTQAGAILSTEPLLISNCKFIDNTTLEWAPAIFSGGELYIYNTLFENNRSVNASAGAIHQLNQYCEIINSVFRGNRCRFQSGALNFQTVPDAKVVNTAFINNTSDESIGGVTVLTVNNNYTNVDFINCSFAGNVSHGGFPILWSVRANSHIGIKNCIVSNNSTGQNLLASNSGTIISNGNNFSDDDTGGLIDGLNGDIIGEEYDAVFVDSMSDLRLQPCSPCINAGDTVGYSDTIGMVDLDGLPRYVNGQVDMGAYEFQGDLINPLIVTNTNDFGCGSLRFILNTSNSGDTIRFIDTINTKPIVMTGFTYSLDAKNIVIDGNDTTNTIIDGAGRTIFALQSGDTLTLNGISILNGEGAIGGNIFNNGGILSIRKSLVANGNAELGGGLLNLGYCIIESSRFEKNMGWEAAGIYNANVAQLFVTHSIIRGNNSIFAPGGGISNDGILELRHSVISGNYAPASEEGGGLFNSGTSQLLNATVAGNYAGEGGGIFNSGDVTLVNSIVGVNSSLNGTNDIFNASGSIIDGGNNLIGDSTGQSVLMDGINGNYVGTQSEPLDPLFVTNVSVAPTCDGDLQLQLCSPAINAGNNDSLSVTDSIDLAMAMRINEFNVDLGAFEFQGVQTEPVAQCRLSDTLMLDPNMYGMLLATDVDSGSTDFCGIDTMYLSQFEFNCTDVGVNNIELIVVSTNRRADTCAMSWTVIPGPEYCFDGMDNDCDLEIDEGDDRGYCCSGGTNPNFFIEMVRIAYPNANTVLLNNSGADPNGYGDYLEPVANIPDNYVPIIYFSAKPGLSRTMYFRIWVDWNQNGSFEPFEMMGQRRTNNTWNGQFSVPAALRSLPASYRMRIIASGRYWVDDACGENPRAETEDYTICIANGCGDIVPVEPIEEEGETVSKVDIFQQPEIDFTDVSVLPNPFTDVLQVFIPLTSSGMISVTILDQSGKVVQRLDDVQGFEGINQMNIPASDMASGLYLLQVETIDGVRVKKVVKE